MPNPEKALPAAGQAKPTQNPAQKAGNTYETDGRERWCLALTFGVCILMADTVLWHGPGAGVTVLVLCWYGLLLAYAGRERLRKGESGFLLAVNLLLALTLALTSNWYFKLWNCGALLLLLPVHAMALRDGDLLPWWEPAMVGQRLRLLFQGLFGYLGASGSALGAEKKGPARRTAALAMGLTGAVILVLILLPVLASADALFQRATASFVDYFRRHFLSGLWRVLTGLILTPFVFGLLYSIRRPRPLPQRKGQARFADPLASGLILGALAVLYLVFLGIQSAGLFGGVVYLAARGISYADWARSGFFQLVFVTAVNLAVVLGAVGLSRREGRGWRAVRGLATALLAESGVLLCSAVWKMTLYVNAYGLSFKRFMTYWGMAVMAVFLTAAVLSVWRKGFRFCRTAFFTAVVGWVLVSFVPVDYLVARDGVDRYLSGQSSVDITYLAWDLSYDTLDVLSGVEGDFRLNRWDHAAQADMTLETALELRREAARSECARWETWNLSAYLAGRAPEDVGRKMEQ